MTDATATSTDTRPATRTDFPPGRRGRYWPWTVICMATYVWILWELDAFRRYRYEDTGEYLERLGHIMFFMGFFPLFGVIFLFLPPGRRAVRVRPGGLIFEPASGRPPTTLPWQAIERIERRAQHRRPDSLWFRIREGHRDGIGKTYRLDGDVYGGSHVELLTAMREVAPQAGYELKGHRLDILHMGGEEWWLTPVERPEP